MKKINYMDTEFEVFIYNDGFKTEEEAYEQYDPIYFSWEEINVKYYVCCVLFAIKSKNPLIQKKIKEKKKNNERLSFSGKAVYERYKVSFETLKSIATRKAQIAFRRYIKKNFDPKLNIRKR